MEQLFGSANRSLCSILKVYTFGSTSLVFLFPWYKLQLIGKKTTQRDLTFSSLLKSSKCISLTKTSKDTHSEVLIRYLFMKSSKTLSSCHSSAIHLELSFILLTITYSCRIITHLPQQILILIGSLAQTHFRTLLTKICG